MNSQQLFFLCPGQVSFMPAMGDVIRGEILTLVKGEPNITAGAKAVELKKGLMRGDEIVKGDTVSIAKN